jgi:hypothetical protein
MSEPLDFARPAARREWRRRLFAPLDESRWNQLARELFTWQFARVPAYRRLCRAHDFTPGNFTSWREIPAVPQQLFKLEKLFVHGSRRPRAIYETSGTTTGRPGRQHVLSTDIYRAVSIEGAKRSGFLANNGRLHFLTPSPLAAPASSLSAMFGFWAKSAGREESRFWARKDRFDFEGLRKEVAADIASRRPVGIAGTAFSFVHLLEAWSHLTPLKLPAGSWLLETGGFKGRSREIPKPELYCAMARLFGVKDEVVWNEYGMSELSSQAYARGTTGLHFAPAWTRVLVWDAAANREARAGERGLARWLDLANIDSVLAVQTLDLAERTHAGFRLIGRLPRTEPRGCSLGAEDLAAKGSVN